jgi:hypothetical protein
MRWIARKRLRSAQRSSFGWNCPQMCGLSCLTNPWMVLLLWSLSSGSLTNVSRPAIEPAKRLPHASRISQIQRVNAIETKTQVANVILEYFRETIHGAPLYPEVARRSGVSAPRFVCVPARLGNSLLSFDALSIRKTNRVPPCWTGTAKRPADTTTPSLGYRGLLSSLAVSSSRDKVHPVSYRASPL